MFTIKYFDNGVKCAETIDEVMYEIRNDGLEMIREIECEDCNSYSPEEFEDTVDSGIRYTVLTGNYEKGKPWTQEDTIVGTFETMDEAKTFAKRFVGDDDVVIIEETFGTRWYAKQNGEEINWER